MPKSTMKIGRISIILHNLPQEIIWVQRTDVIEYIGCRTAICYEFISKRHNIHVDPAAWFLSSLDNLLADKDTLQVVLAPSQ